MGPFIKNINVYNDGGVYGAGDGPTYTPPPTPTIYYYTDRAGNKYTDRAGNYYIARS